MAAETTTISTLTPAELRAGLQELLDLAAQYATLESRIEAKAMELQETDFVDALGPRFCDGIAAQVGATLRDAIGEEGERPAEFGALDLCQSIQDAIDLLNFAIERSNEGSETDA